MTRTTWALAAVLTIGAAVAARAGEGESRQAKSGVDAKTAFAKLKELAGAWEAKTDFPGQDKEKATVTYKVFAAGSALEETQFGGCGHEMISMYHLDGDELLMTHYCAARNQPRLKLDKAASTADDLRFVYLDGTNLDPSKDIHIHGARILIRKDGVESRWEAYEGGKSLGVTTINLSKK